MINKLLLLLLFISNIITAQSTNNYKFASVPSKFEFQKEKNQYRINSTLKSFFQQKGFTTFLDDDILTQEFSASNCNKIYVDLEVKNTYFSTALFVIIKDCKNTILSKSEEGYSRSKDSKVAYNEALLTALKSLKYLQFKSLEQQSLPVKTVSDVMPTKTLEPAKTASNTSFKMFSKKTNSIVTLQKTSQPSVFIATSDTKNGVVTLLNTIYIFEYYDNDALISEVLENQ